MFSLLLVLLALGGFSAAAGRRVAPPAVPDLLPLANFSQTLQQAAVFLSTSGRPSIDLEDCSPRRAVLRLFRESISLGSLRVHGVTDVQVQAVRQQPGDKAHVFFTLQLPRTDAVGLAHLAGVGRSLEAVVSATERRVAFQLRAVVRAVHGKVQIVAMTVARDTPAPLTPWTSGAVDPLDQRLLGDTLLKALDPCVAKLARRLADVTNLLLAGRKLRHNHKLSAAVAKLVNKRLTPAVSLTPLKINRPVRCLIDKQEVVLSHTRVHGVDNCTVAQPAKNGRTLQYVYQCDQVRVSANATFPASKNALPLQIDLAARVFVKLALNQHINRRAAKISIDRIRVADAYLFQYDVATVVPKSQAGAFAAECFKRFIFVEDTAVLGAILHFDRK